MIERFLTKLNLDIHGKSELAILIRREIRTLRVLLYSIGTLVFVYFILLVTGCAQVTTPATSHGESQSRTEVDPLVLEIPSIERTPNVRVYLRSIEEAKQLDIIGPAQVSAARGAVINLAAGEKATLKILGQSLRCEGDANRVTGSIDAPSITIAPKDGAPVSINGHDYEGSFEISAQTGRFLVVNLVGIEEYTRGSVGWEAIPSWPVEALKAQAVAIRTYTLFTIFQKRAIGINDAWDVDDTTNYLRYGGLGKTGAKARHASENVLRAVKESDGEVMLWNGKIFKAFFASNSGGHSASVFTSFGHLAIPPLRGVDLGDYGKGSSLYRWTRSHATEEVSRELAKRNKPVGAISAIRVETNDPSGFLQRVTIVGSERALTLRASEFRQIIGTGPKGLPSTNFSVEVTNGTITFNGRGWGHGVGLDQWAAAGMAQEGLGYRDILRRHYPETTIARPWLKN